MLYLWVVSLALACSKDEASDSALDGGAGPEDGSFIDTATLSECVSDDVTVGFELVPRPIDIVWVIDSSESMRDEARRVQENMNRFVERFGESDIRTIVITDSDTVTVPPPLGTDAFRVLHVDVKVESNLALLSAVSRWGAYGSWIRPDSAVHVVTLTDDESLISAECFIIRMEANLGPDHEYRLHTISSEAVGEAPPSAGEIRRGGDHASECKFTYFWQDTDYQSCPDADHAARQYWRAAAATGGVATSVCTEDWSSIFDQIAETAQRQSAFGCQVALPQAPAGAMFDPAEIKLLSTSAAETLEVSRVQDIDACREGEGGWFLNDESPAAQAVLCPQTCNQFATTGAQLSLDLGCAWRIR